MSENQVQQAVPTPGTASAPGGKGPATHEQKQKRRKLIRRCIALVVALAIVLTSGWALYNFVFKEEDNGLGEVMTSPVTIDSIRSVVNGTGGARAKNAAVVTPESGSNVLELFVAEGDIVEQGQPLYNLDDSAARKAVQEAQEGVHKAQEAVNDTQIEVDKLREELNQLTLRAPHPGKLTAINTDLRAGKDAAAGTEVATLVNDTQFRLHLYYSWNYEGQIQVGQTADISLPALMTTVPGKVEQINYVRRVVPEGGVTFEVVFLLDNPDTLTEGIVASAVLTAADGTTISPYESGKLEYLETTKLTLNGTGPVEWVQLMNYSQVTAGQELVRQGDKDAVAAIAAKQNALREVQKGVDEALKNLADAQKKLENYHAVSPIAGRVLSCGLMPGEPVGEGKSIQIADTSTMLVDINIDERHVGFAHPGMTVDLQDQMGNYYMGVIDQISLTAKSENGVAVFPATVTVDNPGNTLLTGTFIEYQFVASQSDNCMVVPIQAVIKVTLPMDDMGGMDGDLPMDDMGGMDGELPMDDMEGTDDPLPSEDVEGTDDALPSEDAELPDDADSVDAAMSGARSMSGGVVVEVVPDSMGGSAMGTGSMGGFGDPSSATVCFVQGEPDDRAIEADPSWKMPEGFFAVKVTTGLSDDSNVEITSGLNEGDMVFTGYVTNQANTYEG